VILRAALSKRLSHVFRYQIKQAVAVNIVLAERVASVMRFDVFNGLTQFLRQPGLQMVDVANNHDLTLNIKHRFIFIFYTRIPTAIPPLFRRDLRERMFIGKSVNCC
jgi:hypothetical protein